MRHVLFGCLLVVALPPPSPEDLLGLQFPGTLGRVGVSFQTRDREDREAHDADAKALLKGVGPSKGEDKKTMSSTESNPVVDLSAELAKTTLQDGNSRDGGAETGDKNRLPTMPMPMAGTMPPDTTGSGDTDVVRIFIGDLAPHTTEQTLTAYFEKWGTIVRALIKHPESGSTQRTRSFGFISVLGQQAAQAILATPHIIDGVNVGHAELAKQHRAAGYDQTKAGPNMGGGPPGGDGGGWSTLNGMPPTRKIFVGGLSHQTKEGTLYVRA